MQCVCKEKKILDDLYVEKIQIQGISLTLFYIFLGIVGRVVGFLGSLDEKYNLANQLGLDRIW